MKISLTYGVHVEAFDALQHKGVGMPAAERTEIVSEVEKIVETHPLHPVLTSVPGDGVRTAARLITEIVGKQFPMAGTLGRLCRPRPSHEMLRYFYPG